MYARSSQAAKNSLLLEMEELAGAEASRPVIVIAPFTLGHSTADISASPRPSKASPPAWEAPWSGPASQASGESGESAAAGAAQLPPLPEQPGRPHTPHFHTA